MRLSFVPLVLLGVLGAAPASAGDAALPKRQLPPEVVAELRLLEHDFGRALAQDCAPERCFSKGCVYLSHTVVDQPAQGGMPGLRLEPPAADTPRQVFLTTAECSFAHEGSVRARDARALATRLKAKVSRGWTQVEVTYERLQPLPDFLREAPEPPPEEPQPEPPAVEPPPEEEPPPAVTDAPPPVWEGPVALRELWLSLLPHFSWMIALFLLTLATLVVIWALRRLGRESPEEQALLAQMLAGGGAAAPGAADGSKAPDAAGADAVRVARQRLAWQARLAQSGAGKTDPALQALVVDLLRRGERRLLAKAVMLFPEEFPKAFPQEGSLASSKLALAEYLKQVDPTTLPSDAQFFDRLERYALAASLTAQPDTDLIRSLHDEVGTRALVDLLAALPARNGALLFALAPESRQLEVADLLNQRQTAALVDPLLRSNRMDPRETEHLLAVLTALRSAAPLPPAPALAGVSDRGVEFDATAALSVLLPRLGPELRGQLVAEAAGRNGGRLAAWVEGTLYGEMLLALEATARNDLLLQVDVETLAAWLRVQTSAAQAQLLDAAPNALRVALASCAAPATPEALLALAAEGRAALSGALRRQLRRDERSFHSLLV